MVKSQQSSPKTLGDVRVLDLASEAAVYCAKLLADLGADVIKVERPGGDATRRIGPFVADDPHPEKSLHFFHFNTNKRSITLDIETVDGRAILKKLVKTSDVMVETFPVGYLDRIGLGYSVLRDINPRLVLTSVSGFGQTGPYKDFKTSDIVAVAMGGLMYIGGFPEVAPNYPGACQAYHLASADAAIGTLAALIYRDATGEGQHVDVSLQQSVSISNEVAMTAYDTSGFIRRRTGRKIARFWNEVFPCRDGYVVGSPLCGRQWREILSWMDDEGMSADLGEPQYQDLLDQMAELQSEHGVDPPGERGRSLREKAAMIAHVEEVWESFLMTHTRDQLFEGCQARRGYIAPIYSSADVANDAHLLDRGFFVEVTHPELNMALKYPGTPYILSETPCRLERRAPQIGEHNLEIYEEELGLSREELLRLKEAGVI